MIKKVSRIVLAAAGVVFGLGLVFRLAGSAMGGRAQIQNPSEGHSDSGVYVGDDGIYIGGEDGVHINGNWADLTDGWKSTVKNWAGTGAFPAEVSQTAGTEHEEAFNKISVSVDYGDVTLKEGTDFGVALDWSVDDYSLHYENQNGVLKVWSVSEKHGDGYHSPGSATVVVTVPAGTKLGEVDLETALGNVTADLSAFAQKAELSTNMGDVRCERLTVCELDAETDLGDVDIRFPEKDGVSYELGSDLGSVRVNGAECSSSVEYREPGSQYSIQAGTSMGGVSLQLG